jgi:hypothetical protein
MSSEEDSDSDSESGVVSTIEKPIKTTIYLVEFTSGYIIRQVLEFHEKLTIEGIPLYFRESQISILTGTNDARKSRSLISNGEIDTDDLINYHLNLDQVNIPGDDETEPCYVEQFNIDSIKGILKSIQKKNRIRLHKTTLSDVVELDIQGDSNLNVGIKCCDYQAVDYDISKFDDVSPKPNVKVEMVQFCNSIKGLARGNSGYTSFKIFKKGLFLESYSANGAITKNGYFGEVVLDKDENPKDGEYIETRVSTSAMKALQKIGGMAEKGIVKITSEKPGYLKINHKIGDFGEHNIYLTDTSGED